jgi:hypothetical protein
MLTKPVQTFFSRIIQFFGGETPPDKSNRSSAGLLLTLALIPLLLSVLACFGLPVPVGDPEKSRIDPTMSGIWAGDDIEGDLTLIVLDPYDKRSWLLSIFVLEVGQDVVSDEPTEPGDSESKPETSPLQLLHPDSDMQIKIGRVALYKAWLTRIKGVTFITWESKNLSETLPEMVPESWWAFRVRRSGDDILYLDAFDYDIDDLDKAKTRKEAEKIIGRHLNDPEFFNDIEDPFMELHRVPESDYETVTRLLDDFGMNQ